MGSEPSQTPESSTDPYDDTRPAIPGSGGLGGLVEDLLALGRGAQARPPEQVGPYRILEILGEGGMGIVYLAEQREPVRRRVALKLIKLGMDTREVIARFEAERQALALMSHPNIARVYEAGATPEGRPYFAMEAVEGLPITEYCDRHNLDIPGRLALFVQVCRGVEHAHHRGVIHRDLKPTNILVTAPDDEPLPKIIDFGLARAINQRLTEKTVYTRCGVLVGTPAYMSPEQAEMTGEGVDHRTDIYSLGALLYELLVGQIPLEIDIRSVAYDELIRRIRQEEPVTPSTRWSRLNPEMTTTLASRRSTSSVGLVHELRGDLDWICMRALEKERQRRYPTASHLVADIERYLGGNPVEARPPSGLYRLRKYVRKNRRFVTAAATVVIVLLAGLAGSLAMYLRSEEARDELSKTLEENRRLLGEVERESLLRGEALAQNESLVSELREETEAKSEALEETRAALRRADGLRLAAQSSLARAGDPGLSVLLGLEAARRVSPEDAPNDVLLAALEALHERKTLVGHSGVVLWSVFSPGGDRVLTASADRTARLWDPATGEETLRLEGHTARVNSASFSPDGTRVLTASDDGTARIWDSATGKEIRSLSEGSGRVFSAAFSPDGERIVTASPGAMAGLWDMPSGNLIQSFNEEAESLELEPLVFAAFSPDGRKVVTAVDFIFGPQIASIDGSPWVRPSLLVRDVPSGKRSRSLAGSTESLRTAVFSPDARFVLTAPVEGPARLWEIATGKAVVEFNGHVGGVHCAAFSPDGERVVTAGHDRTARVWETSSGKELLRLSGHREAVRSAHFSPDGTQVVTASADGTARTWALRSELFATLTGHSGHVHHVRFGPGGEYVLSASFQDFASAKPRHHFLVPMGDHTLRLWSPGTGQQLTRIDIDGLFKAVGLGEGGETILYAHRSGKVSVWEASTGEELSAGQVFGPSGQPDSFTSDDERPLSFSADGGTLLTALYRNKALARVWKVSTGELLSTLRGHTGRGRIRAGHLDADGRLAVTAAGDGTVRVWAIPQGEEISRMQVGGVSSVTLDSSGDRVVTAHRDGTARLWEAATGTLVATLAGHEAWVNSVEFSPDGRFVVSASADRTARVWETATGHLHLTIRGHSEPLNHAAFSEDGQRVVTASDDGTVRIWPANPLEAARRLKPRELTTEERELYRVDSAGGGTGARRF